MPARLELMSYNQLLYVQVSNPNTQSLPFGNLGSSQEKQAYYRLITWRTMGFIDP